MSAFLDQVARGDDNFRRLARFFRADADTWERLQVRLPPRVFGEASHQEFSTYLEGPSGLAIRSFDEICEFLRCCEAMADARLFRRDDHWQHPSAFEGLRKGDCEDHALWAWRALHRIRIPALFVAGLWRGTPHAWVVLGTGAQEHVLETTEKSGRMLIPTPEARRDYIPALAVDHRLRTFAYQGYQRLHQSHRGHTGPAALVSSATEARGRQRPTRTNRWEVIILAGGLGSRMGGRDKARLRVGGRSMLSWVRTAAAGLGHPVKVQRHDGVERCGPLGGVLTALDGTKADVLLFLACDMPAVTDDLLLSLKRRWRPGDGAVFASVDGKLGFPFAIAASARQAVRKMWEDGGRSLFRLAEVLEATCWDVPRRYRPRLVNVNTPADLERLPALGPESSPGGLPPAPKAKGGVKAGARRSSTPQ